MKSLSLVFPLIGLLLVSTVGLDSVTRRQGDLHPEDLGTSRTTAALSHRSRSPASAAWGLSCVCACVCVCVCVCVCGPSDLVSQEQAPSSSPPDGLLERRALLSQRGDPQEVAWEMTHVRIKTSCFTRCPWTQAARARWGLRRKHPQKASFCL